MSNPSYEELAARVRELEDINEINDVFFKWHHECTGGFNGIQAGRMEALECLTEDATIEVQGLHEPGKGPTGREQYTEFWDFFYGDAGPLPYVFQCPVSNRVTIKGDLAEQESIQLGLFEFRGRKPTMGLSQRVNSFRRTPEGWRIYKTTIKGGMSYETEPLQGNLNELPPMEDRKMWSYQES